MAKQTTRRKTLMTAEPTPFEQARDELFQHIMRCGVIGAAPEHQAEWFHDTIGYLTTRFPELEAPQLLELRTLGERFAKPPKGGTSQEEPTGAASAA